MNSKKKQSLFFAGIILLGLGVTGLSLYKFNQTHEGLQDIKPDVEVDAITLYSAFEGNEQQANQLYLGKIIETEGNISSIETPSAETVNIVIQALDDSFGGINCSFTELDKTRLKSLKKGDKVKIRGECAGFLMDVNLVRCVLISS